MSADHVGDSSKSGGLSFSSTRKLALMTELWIIGFHAVFSKFVERLSALTAEFVVQRRCGYIVFARGALIFSSASRSVISNHAWSRLSGSGF